VLFLAYQGLWDLLFSTFICEFQVLCIRVRSMCRINGIGKSHRRGSGASWCLGERTDPCRSHHTWTQSGTQSVVYGLPLFGPSRRHWR
jgi:hypothetical protein